MIVAVSPFPELPTFVGLVRVPHAEGQAAPPFVKAHVAPWNFPLLWEMVAVKTVWLPAAIEGGGAWSERVVVFCPMLQPENRESRAHTKSILLRRRNAPVTLGLPTSLRIRKPSFGCSGVSTTSGEHDPRVVRGFWQWL